MIRSRKDAEEFVRDVPKWAVPVPEEPGTVAIMFGMDTDMGRAAAHVWIGPDGWRYMLIGHGWSDMGWTAIEDPVRWVYAHRKAINAEFEDLYEGRGKR